MKIDPNNDTKRREGRWSNDRIGVKNKFYSFKCEKYSKEKYKLNE